MCSASKSDLRLVIAKSSMRMGSRPADGEMVVVGQHSASTKVLGALASRPPCAGGSQLGRLSLGAYVNLEQGMHDLKLWRLGVVEKEGICRRVRPARIWLDDKWRSIL